MDLRELYKLITRRDARQVHEQGSVISAALSAGRSDLGDEQAVALLSERVRVDRGGAENALRLLRGGRQEYERDRAVRLLEAAIGGKPVSSPPTHLAGLFMREKELGELPILDAFNVLVELEPQLAQLRTNADAHADSEMALSEVLGPNGSQDDQLVKSQLALSLVSHFFLLSVEQQADGATASYFSSQRRRVVRST